MSRAAQQAAIRAELAQHPELADREIARHIGCDHKTVAAIRRKLAEIPQQERKDKPMINFKSTQPAKMKVEEPKPPADWEPFFTPDAYGFPRLCYRPPSKPAPADDDDKPKAKVLCTLNEWKRRHDQSLERLNELRVKLAAEERGKRG